MAKTNIEPSAKIPSNRPNNSLFSNASKYDTGFKKVYICPCLSNISLRRKSSVEIIFLINTDLLIMVE